MRARTAFIFLLETTYIVLCLVHNRCSEDMYQTEGRKDGKKEGRKGGKVGRKEGGRKQGREGEESCIPLLSSYQRQLS